VLAIRAGKESEAALASRFGRVLVPIAGADFGTNIGERTAGIFGTSEVEYVLFHAVVPVPILNAPDPAVIPPLVDLNADEKAAHDLLDALSEPLRARSARVTTLVVIDASPASAIRAAASDTNADVISMATHGYRGVKRLVLGSVADSVLRHATVPLLLVRPPESAELTEDQKAERVAVT
jgi:nucleotide-binding universal stress UspA family protein